MMPFGDWFVGPLVCLSIGPSISLWVRNSFFLGSGPDRGQSPVEWGEILSIHPSIRLSIRPSIRPPQGLKGRPTESEGQPAGSEGQLEGYGGQPAGSEGQPEGGRTNKQNFSSFYRTLSPVGAAAPKTIAQRHHTVRGSLALLL